MKKSNLFITVVVLAIMLIVGLACKSITSPEAKENSPKPIDTTETTETNNDKDSEDLTEKEADTPKSEKADFSLTAEELDKEFTNDNAKDEDLKKYANKNIAVSGRVSMLVTEKKGTTQPWVTLYAPGVLHGVSCYFDDENIEQMKQLKMDKMAKVQGFQNDFIVPKVSPRLEHCIVLESD